jgi:hypothetical protein
LHLIYVVLYFWKYIFGNKNLGSLFINIDSYE